MGKVSSSKAKKGVTIKDVATAAEVSIATVSYVLNNKPGQSISEETRKKVLQFANLLGYECNVMARYLATGKTSVVSLVLKDVDGFAAQYYLNLITELSRLLSRKNFTLKISDFSDEIERTGDTCDAYITVALSEKEFREFADTKYKPVIAIDSVFDDFLFYRVNDDYEKLCLRAKRAIGKDGVTLLSFGLSAECEASARLFFDRVITVKTLSDLSSLDGDCGYATTCKAISDCVPTAYFEGESFARKAAAAVDAVFKAIDRVQSSSEEHDVRV
ncbi:MAG: LacI family DNA-binding transcriptional regulator [Clostridiales bacterium]|nr:LacI family DNA-binding transcriptional regulator [Clostridiales bacterium]